MTLSASVALTSSAPQTSVSSGQLSAIAFLEANFAVLCMRFTYPFCGIRRDDGVEDRYSVLVEFEDQKSADGFYLDLNGWRFSSSEVANIVNWISVLFADHVQDRC